MALKILIQGNDKPDVVSDYVNAVKLAGAEPTHRVYSEVDLDFDGLILSGGGDIHPKYYGQEINGSIRIDEQRDNAEYDLFNAYLKAGIPIFGICRGCQFINVMLGGSLIQHIDCHERHTGGKFHKTTALNDGFIGKLYGEEFITNSFHHQALDKLGDGLKAVQWSENGQIVEAIEHQSLPIFAVQWHPERMAENSPYYDEAKKNGAIDSKKLFEYFIQICEKHKK